MENVVEITNLTRDDVQSVLRCRAVNNNISAPVETRILLDIIRKIILGKLLLLILWQVMEANLYSNLKI